MGRIKTRILKTVTKDILKKDGDKFSADFEHNKEAVSKCADIPSKKLRNIIAGYAARLKRTEKY